MSNNITEVKRENGATETDTSGAPNENIVQNHLINSDAKIIGIKTEYLFENFTHKKGSRNF